MTNPIPSAPVASFGIDQGADGGERHVCSVLQGARVLHVLADGEDWFLHPSGGIVVAHPDRKPVWVREENGEVVREVLEVGPPILWNGGYALPMKAV